MNKTDLAAAVGNVIGDAAAAREAVDGFCDVIIRAVAAGERVAIPGFGTFDAAGTQGTLRPRFEPAAAFQAAVGEAPLQPGAPPQLDDLPLRFQRYSVPEGVSLSALLPEHDSRCGIYLLHFEDGAHYVGQSVDVLTRFANHRRHWQHRIVGISFAPAPSGDLDDLERRTLQHFEREGARLYNSALVGLPMGDSPLDLEIDRVDQERWLNGIDDDAAYDLTDRFVLAASRPREGDNFDRLSSREDYADILGGIMVYLFTAIPWPHQTERRFWSLTCLPSTNRSRNQHRLAVVSVNNVETLVISEILTEEGWLAAGFINVAPGVVHMPGAEVRRSRYRTVGEVDTLNFAVGTELYDLLMRPDVIEAARRTALGLMRKGQGMMAKYHDESLADAVFVYLQTALGETAGQN